VPTCESIGSMLMRVKEHGYSKVGSANTPKGWGTDVLAGIKTACPYMTLSSLDPWRLNPGARILPYRRGHLRKKGQMRLSLLIGHLD